MTVHVLPGDAQVEEFAKTGLEGEVVVCREALIDGDVRSESLEDFWRVREDFFSRTYPDAKADYREAVVTEFKKLDRLSKHCDVNLWFEYELFCQVNMWFCIWLLRDAEVELYRVAPVAQRHGETWSGFGRMTSVDLIECYARRVKFTDRDIHLGTDLWLAYQGRDYAKLKQLSTKESACFPYLREACDAEIEKATRPKQVLTELRQEKIENFPEILAAFRERAGVYGFGDAQIKRILNEI